MLSPDMEAASHGPRQDEGGSKFEALLQKLTLEEKVSLLSGLDFVTTPGVPRLGIPPLKV